MIINWKQTSIYLRLAIIFKYLTNRKIRDIFNKIDIFKASSQQIWIFSNLKTFKIMTSLYLLIKMHRFWVKHDKINLILVWIIKVSRMILIKEMRLLIKIKRVILKIMRHLMGLNKFYQFLIIRVKILTL